MPDSDDMLWEEVERNDIPRWTRLFVVYDKSDETVYPQIFVTNADRSASIGIAAYDSSLLAKAREDAAAIEVPSFAYDYCWNPGRWEEILNGSTSEKTETEPSPPTLQELLVAKYGADAWIGVHCSGWANYRTNPNDGAVWKHGFSIRAGAWDDDCGELSELAEYEFEATWGLLDMSGEAWVNELVVSVGEDTFAREYRSHGDDQLLARDLEAAVEGILIAGLNG